MSIVLNTFQFKTFDCEAGWKKITDVLKSVLSAGSIEPISSQVWLQTFQYVYMMHNSFSDPFGVKFYSKTRSFFVTYTKEISDSLLSCRGLEFSEKYFIQWERFRNAIDYVNKLYSSFNRSIHKIKSGLVPPTISRDFQEEIQEIDNLMRKIWLDEVIHVSEQRIYQSFADFFNKLTGESDIECSEKYLPLLAAFSTSIYYCEGLVLEPSDSRLFKIIEENCKSMRTNLVVVNWNEDFEEFVSQLLTCLDRVFFIIPSIIDGGHIILSKVRESLTNIILGNDVPKLATKFGDILRLGVDSPICDKIFKVSCDHSELLELISKQFFNYCFYEFTYIIKENVDSPKKLCEVLSSKKETLQTFICKYSTVQKILEKKLVDALRISAEIFDKNISSMFNLTKYMDSLIFSVQPWELKVTHKHIGIIIELYNLFYSKESFNKILMSHMCRKIVFHHPKDPDISIFEILTEYLSEDFLFAIKSVMTDYMASCDTENEYKKSCSTNYELTLLTARQTLWPFNGSKMTPYYPEDLHCTLMEYLDYYKQQNVNHKLEYDHEESSGTIQYIINNSVYLMDINGYQLSILNFIIKHRRVNTKQIEEATGLSDKKIHQCLLPLVHHNIILYEANKFYAINLKFNSKTKQFQLKYYLDYCKSDTDICMDENENRVRASTGSLFKNTKEDPVKYLLHTFIKLKKRVTFEDMMNGLRENKYGLNICEEDVRSYIAEFLKIERIKGDENDANIFIYVE